MNRKGLSFGDALERVQEGHRLARAGWHGIKWIAYSPGASALPAEKFWAGPNRAYAQQNGGHADVLPCLTMKMTDGSIQMGWNASQSDMLATDWEIVA